MNRACLGDIIFFFVIKQAYTGFYTSSPFFLTFMFNTMPPRYYKSVQTNKQTKRAFNLVAHKLRTAFQGNLREPKLQHSLLSQDN